MRAWIRNFRIVLALAAVFAAVSSFSAEVDSLVSPGGMPFLHIQDGQYENVVMQVYWPSNWSFNNARNPMVPLVTTQVVYTGTAEGVDLGELGRRLEELEAQRGLNPTAESVTGAVVAPAENFEEVAELLNLVISNPAFDPGQANRIKQALVNRVGQLRQGIDATAWELARNLIMRENPLKGFFSTSAESESFIEAATIDELEQFYNQTVTRSDPTIVLSSPFTADHVGSIIDELLDGLPEGGAVEPPETEIDFPAGDKVVLHDPDVERSYLILAGILPPVSQGGEFEDAIALAVLGQGGTSKLYEVLSPELGANYEFSAAPLALTSRLRILQVTGTVDTDKLAFAHQVIRQTYADFRENGLNSSIDGIKGRSSANMRINVENPRILVPLVMESVLNGFPPARAIELPDEIEAITQDSINRRMRDVFPPVEDLLTVIATSDPTLFPDACVVETPEEYRNCL